MVQILPDAINNNLFNLKSSQNIKYEKVQAELTEDDEKKNHRASESSSLHIYVAITIVTLFLFIISFTFLQKDNSPKKKKILGLHARWAEGFLQRNCPGFNANYSNLEKRFKQFKRLLSENYGNAVWSEAAYRLVDRDKWEVWYIHGWDGWEYEERNQSLQNKSCPASTPPLWKNNSKYLCGAHAVKEAKYIPCIDALMVPTANILQDQDRTPEKFMVKYGIVWHLTKIVQYFNKPTLLVGIGIQAEFEENETDLTAKRLNFNEKSIRLLHSVETLSPGGWLARGKLTTDSAVLSGASGGLPVGCPSLFLNPNPCLGRSIEKQFQVLAGPLEWLRWLKIAILLPTLALERKNSRAHKAMFHFLKGILDTYPNAFVASQNYYSASHWLKRWGYPPHRQRFYMSIESWRQDLQEVDLVFGGRIHGTMMGIAAGRPTITIANDARILEMTRVMKLPHVVAQDFLTHNWTDVIDVVRAKAKEYSGKVWDDNRARVMRIYHDVFSKVGLDIDPKRLAIASATCDDS